MTEPADALRDLTELLRGERSVIGRAVADSDERPVLGILAAAGPRTADRAPDYALVVEAVREGYLLHYEPSRVRVVREVDRDLALLAGDYLYALGLDRLAELGDLHSVRELSDLIGLAAQIHDSSRSPRLAGSMSSALWLACATAIATGPDPALDAAKRELGAEPEAAIEALTGAAVALASAGGFDRALREAAAGLDFRADHLSSLG